MSDSSNFIIDFAIGGLTGSIGKTIFAPLDRIKLILQTQDSNFRLKHQKYKGILDCIQRVYKEEGLFSFWKGNFPNLLLYFPTTAFNFAFKDKFHILFKIHTYQENFRTFFLLNLLAGGLAGAACNFLIFPLKLARLCIGVDTGIESTRQFHSLRHFYQTVYSRKGVRGIYSGLCNSLLSVFIFRGVHFGLYDTGKVCIHNFEHKMLIEKLMFAQLVTIIAETVTYPSDTLKRRMMMNGFGEKRVYKNSFDCFFKIIRNEGFKGFFKGNLSNLIKSGSNSVILVLYDVFKVKSTNIQ